MKQPSRETTAGRVYLDIRARARQEGRPTDELLVLYVLERFLFRVSRSAHRSRLILKGGMLLAALDTRRPTRDIDLLARMTPNDTASVAALVRDVLEVDADDGVTFEPDRLRADVIRDADPYAGVRITVPALVARARHPLRIDVNVGDPITPGPIEIEYPALLDEPFEILGYPLATVLAEKLVTMIDRGDTTTRERDFADVVLLISHHTIDADELAAAIRTTADHRRSELRALRSVLIELGATRQPDWERFVDRSGLVNEVPASYAEAISTIADFADPILTGEVTAGTWNPAQQAWLP